jgi:hypothetical protein
MANREQLAPVVFHLIYSSLGEEPARTKLYNVFLIIDIKVATQAKLDASGVQNVHHSTEESLFGCLQIFTFQTITMSAENL